MNSAEVARENEALRAKLAEVENKLAEAQEVIRAIQSGDVDAVVVSGPQGERVFTLEEAEYAYRALVEAMNEGAATLNADGIVLYCNQRLSDLFGVPLEQLIGNSPADLFADEGRHKFQTVFAHALRGNAATAELDLNAPDGRDTPAYVSVRKMEAAEPTALCMVVTDLTEHKKRDELIAAGRLATSILESAAEAIAVCDETGKIIMGNAALEELCGFNPVLQAFDIALPLEVSPAHGELSEQFSISAALGGMVPRSREVTFRRKDGQLFSLLMSSGWISSESGVAGCVITMADITDRKRAEKALIQAEKLASVGRMASSIAHEINNPLETIGHVLYLTANDPCTSKEAKSLLNIATQELDRVTHITKQTLAFHRQSRSLNPLDLRESVDGILNLFVSRLKCRGITVEKRYAEVPQINAVSGEVQQIISNLLSNSMDAVKDPGTIKIHISRALIGNGPAGVRLTVADTGSGIPPERLKRIFEAFFTTKDMVGTGLGLWVTKQIVEKHGATIRVRSKLGHGSAFSIVFPAAQPTQ